MKQLKRPERGRLLFLTRDSGGKHEMTPGEYVLSAISRAASLGLTFAGSPQVIEQMIRNGSSSSGDIYLDYDVKGNQLSRPGLDAFLERIKSDATVTHVFIPRRDRLARPDQALDGAQLELSIRLLGVTIIFLDQVCEPVCIGDQHQLGDLITSVADYYKAGKDRRDLAEKMIFSQLALGKAGFSIGGRPRYGFRRWLTSVNGQAVRQLLDGERVRMAGHHVVWLPVPMEHPEMVITFRILEMLETMPASRVAAQLTLEHVPTPDFGRTRKDNKIVHSTSGVWHAVTVTNIARNPLLLAVLAYGRRSMGDRLRFDVNGPRPMCASDYRDDGKPKVIQNDESRIIKSTATFKPLVDLDRQNRLLQTLNKRAGTQRGKPRSRSADQNPLGGGRLVDISCTWPMYRVPTSKSFKYKCGAYMQSHGATCNHNPIDGPKITKVALDVLRQKLLKPAAIEKLKARIRQLASEGRTDETPARELAAKEMERRQCQQDYEKAGRNLALASSPKAFETINKVFDELGNRIEKLDSEILALTQQSFRPRQTEDDMDAAFAMFDRLTNLANDVTDLSNVTKAFDAARLRVFLKFAPVAVKKRTVNRVRYGKITFGDEAPPVIPYAGPTGRRALKENTTAIVAVGSEETLPDPIEPIGRKSR